MSDQDGKNLPTVGRFEGHPGQESPCLDELAEHIRDAHTSITAAFSNAIDDAIDAGQELTNAKKLALEKASNDIHNWLAAIGKPVNKIETAR
jgi:hypothetical protein